MLEGPIFRDLIRFSLPAIAIGIVSTLYNAADVAVLGIFGGTEAMRTIERKRSWRCRYRRQYLGRQRFKLLLYCT